MQIFMTLNTEKSSSPFNRQPYKMIIHIQTIRGLLPTDSLSVFDHFVRLALKGLMVVMKNTLEIFKLRKSLI